MAGVGNTTAAAARRALAQAIKRDAMALRKSKRDSFDEDLEDDE